MQKHISYDFIAALVTGGNLTQTQNAYASMVGGAILKYIGFMHPSTHFGVAIIKYVY